MILGLDVSTSITGATVLDDNGEIIYCEAWDFRNKRKYPTLFQKAQQFQRELENLHQIKRFKIDEVFIEQSLQAFRPGFSSAKTLLTLARFNCKKDLWDKSRERKKGKRSSFKFFT